MSLSSGFLWRFLDDVWDILPSEDRELFEAYWRAQIRIASNLEQKTIEAALSTEVNRVPVYLTERWNRFVMDDTSCDLFQQVDLLTLTMFTTASVSKETAFFDTLRVSTSSGQIQYQETMQFFDSSVRALRYGKLIKGTVSVSLAGKEFTINRDYVVNLTDGTIQALDSGRIPTNELVTIRYQHQEYTRDLDYELDEVAGTIKRITGTNIGDGDQVKVIYTYNATATLPIEGVAGSVDGSTLTDTKQDFSAVRPGRKLTIASGPNAGTYTVNGVPEPHQVTIAELFPQGQEGEVVYSLNAFPHGIKVDKAIVSIPHLRDLVETPTAILVEGVDYLVRDGILSLRTAFPMSAIGPTDLRERQMWAETVKLDKETPYRNFGVLIDFYRKNSEDYKAALQGLWYSFWTGSTPGNLQRGLHILLGLPFAKKAGTVTRVDTVAGEIDVTDPRGQIITYAIPSGLTPTVTKGASIPRFEALTTGVQIIDRNNEPGFVANRLGRAGIDRFLTSLATKGPGNTDETKALKLLEHHLFLPQILVEAITHVINVQELITFLDNMKPAWTTYVFSFQSDQTENVTFQEYLPENAVDMDLTTTVNNNELNQSFSINSFIAHRHSGHILGGGSQVTGNFEDASADFAALGVDTDALIWVPEGAFLGFHRVLARLSPTLLSLDIPDDELQTVLSLEYFVLSAEQARLGHDAIDLGFETYSTGGRHYLTPTTYNTKTDADLTGLTNDLLKTLVLLDIGLSGHEIQQVTAGDVSLNEFTVGTAPAAPALHGHTLAAAALKRVDNSGPTVTDLYAI